MPTSPDATGPAYDDAGVHLVRGPDRSAYVDLLAERLGGRVGLEGVLADLNREARPASPPGAAVAWGFRPDEADSVSRRWWPQGITTSADAGPGGHGATTIDGRSVVITSAYAKPLRGESRGVRITVHDVTDPDRVRYRHVLLVEAGPSRGDVDLLPVRVHAGGLVWHRGRLYVAATRRGLLTLDLDDIMRLPAGDPDRLGLHRGEAHAYGYRYVLPVRSSYDAATDDGATPFRFSFVSLGREGERVDLVAGEYGRGQAPRRLVRYRLDPRTGLPETVGGEVARPWFVGSGVPQMQGVTVADGRWHLSTSAGAFRMGSLWTGEPGSWRQHRFAVPAGPEDLALDLGHDRLWSLTEHPGHRYVVALDPAALDRP